MPAQSSATPILSGTEVVPAVAGGFSQGIRHGRTHRLMSRSHGLWFCTPRGGVGRIGIGHRGSVADRHGAGNARLAAAARVRDTVPVGLEAVR